MKIVCSCSKALSIPGLGYGQKLPEVTLPGTMFTGISEAVWLERSIPAFWESAYIFDCDMQLHGMSITSWALSWVRIIESITSVQNCLLKTDRHLKRRPGPGLVHSREPLIQHYTALAGCSRYANCTTLPKTCRLSPREGNLITLRVLTHDDSYSVKEMGEWAWPPALLSHAVTSHSFQSLYICLGKYEV